jgi:hypothetical protein
MTEDYTIVRAEGDGWRFDFEEREITLIGVIYQTRLQFGPTEVVIESPFDLVVGETRHSRDPSERPKLGPLLAIYPDALVDAVATANGVLRLAFASGSTITVPPDPRYEAWSVVGRAGSLVVCTPGGELAIWDAPGAQSRQ